MLGPNNLRILLTFASFSAQTSFAATLFQSVHELPSGVDYDFIIAGGNITLLCMNQ